MNKIYLFGILMPMMLFGQSDMQNVISSSGNHFNNGSVQISYTIGEAIINTFSSSSNKLTQGFHQTNLQIADIKSHKPSIEISVYPNPFGDQFNIQTECFEKIGYELYDNSGKLILNGDLDKPITQIETVNLAPSDYSLRLIGKDQTTITTCKVIKIK